MRYRVQFVITGLGVGGAERMLLKLLTNIDRRDFEPEVVSLTAQGKLTDELSTQFHAIDVPVHFLGMHRGVPDPRGVYRLAKWLRQRSPHLVNTWMYHADLIGGVAAKLAGDIPVVWNIRHSNLHPSLNKKTTVLTARSCALLSGWLPRKIICCAEESKKIHIHLGYDSLKMIVIPNGFDLTRFRPDPTAKADICKEIGIPHDSRIIGLIARFDPLKDHQNFIRAAHLLKKRDDKLHFILCGEGISKENRQLVNSIKSAELKGSFHLLGHRSDIPRINASFDIATSSSCGEGFSNTIGEAMACGVPCVVTDVGDSSYIVGNTGKVVPPRNSETMANAWQELLELTPRDRNRLGLEARQRVLDLFSLDRVTRQYETVFRNVLEFDVR